MNVACPECRSVFRVDPVKVPQAGVRTGDGQVEPEHLCPVLYQFFNDDEW